MKVLGKIGKVKKIFPDEDIKIEINGESWTFNPLAVTKVHLEAELVKKKSSDSLELTTKNSNSAQSSLPGELLRAAASGDLKKCEELLKMPDADVRFTRRAHI